jgi:hypothetical protein
MPIQLVDSMTIQCIMQMLPVGFFMAMTLWTGNEVYLYLTVAFIQVLNQCSVTAMHALCMKC